MKNLLSIIIITVFSLIEIVFPQVENVQITHGVYTFLKEMKVKRVISFIRDDDPVLSRFEIENLLEDINNHSAELSSTEKKYWINIKLNFLIH